MGRLDFRPLTLSCHISWHRSGPSWRQPQQGARYITLALLIVGLCGCTTYGPAPITEKQVQSEARPKVGRRSAGQAQRHSDAVVPAFHRIVRGDTLHAIAWRYRLDYRDLVRWNKISNPDLIVIGRKLRLNGPAPRIATATKPSRVAKPAKPARSTAPARPAKTPATAVTAVNWQWPASGKMRLEKSVSGSQGVEIRGAVGQHVKAAGDGVVVYSGSGLRGYGELIIVKHNDTFLSAYAHNKNRLANEGDRVQAGQLIAHMGDSEAHDVMLHFEIRRNGKTVDPFKYLPER